MINLEGLTFAQKLHVLKWTSIKEQPSIKQPTNGKPRRGEPGYVNNQTPARKKLDAEKTARTFSKDCPYWITYHDARQSGLSHPKCYAKAEGAWRSIKGEGRYTYPKLAETRYRTFLKYNNL